MKLYINLSLTNLKQRKPKCVITNCRRVLELKDNNVKATFTLAKVQNPQSCPHFLKPSLSVFFLFLIYIYITNRLSLCLENGVSLESIWSKQSSSLLIMLRYARKWQNLTGKQSHVHVPFLPTNFTKMCTLKLISIPLV